MQYILVFSSSYHPHNSLAMFVATLSYSYIKCTILLRSVESNEGQVLRESINNSIHKSLVFCSLISWAILTKSKKYREPSRLIPLIFGVENSWITIFKALLNYYPCICLVYIRLSNKNMVILKESGSWHFWIWNVRVSNNYNWTLVFGWWSKCWTRW